MKDLWSYKSILVWLGAVIFVRFIMRPETPSIYVDIILIICFYILGRGFVDFIFDPLFKKYFPKENEK